LAASHLFREVRLAAGVAMLAGLFALGVGIGADSSLLMISARFPPGDARGRMPSQEEPVMLSKRALALFREHLEQRRTIDVDTNREAYRELARAGLMVAGNSFAGGDESVYHVTKEGFERRAELLIGGFCLSP
jgi:hypothetical protein